MVDNTNPSVEARRLFVSVARQLKVPCRCVVMDTPRAVTEVNAEFRAKQGQQAAIPQVAFRTYDTAFRRPTLAEGFDKIDVVQFVLDAAAETDPDYVAAVRAALAAK